MSTKTNRLPNAVNNNEERWNFWISFAWIRTRSLDIARELNDASQFNLPLLLRRVREHAEINSAQSTSVRWQETWVQLAGLCLDGKVRAFGKPTSDTNDNENETAAIDPIYWALAATQNGDDFDSGGHIWKQLEFDTSDILACFPSPRTSSKNRSYSVAEAQKFVDRMVAENVPLNQIFAVAKIEFPADQRPTKKFLEDRYGLLVPNPRRGRRPIKMS
jgi:hypothetical protein